MLQPILKSMTYLESLEEMIDELVDDEPFLTVGARAVLATYMKLLAEEKKNESLFHFRNNRPNQPANKAHNVSRPSLD